MSNRTAHPRLSALFGCLLAAALGLAVLAGTLRFMGTSAPLLERRLHWEGAPELTAADRGPVARLIADTMAGRQDTFQYKGLFSEQARIHMADCVPLFTLALVTGLSGLGLSLSSAALCVRFGDRRRTGTGMLIGVGVLLAAVLALGVWGLIDFDGLFTAFHRAFFTNDLWQFTADDLLIRLMPLPFFIRCAAWAGGLWLACLTAMAATAVLLIMKDRKKTRA